MMRRGGITQQHDRSLSNCIILLGCLVFMTAGPALADWEFVGTPGFASAPMYMDLALSNDSTPYVTVHGQGYKLGIMRFNGTRWEVVGDYFTGDTWTYERFRLTLSNNDIPYIVYDSNPGHQSGEKQATVMRFNRGQWEAVGKRSFTGGSYYNVGLVVTSQGVPYVTYTNTGTNRMIMVKRLNETQWESIGSPGNGGTGDDVTLISADDDSLYIAYPDSTNNDRLTVKHFDGTAWNPIGPVGFSAGTPEWVDLAVTHDGIPYVAYTLERYPKKLIVQRLDNRGEQWELLDSPASLTPYPLQPRLALASDGTPYVAYIEDPPGPDENLVVIRFDGTEWRLVGSVGFGKTFEAYPSFALSNNDTPYIAYRDVEPGREGKTTVMKFVDTDNDGDGVPDDQDACPGFDDSLDADGDGVPDGCDADDDNDGVPDGQDACPGADDSVDVDGDLVPDGCDLVITKTQTFTDRGNNSVYVGDSIFYTLTVSNFLRLPYLQLQVTDLLDEGLTYQSGDVGVIVDSNTNLLTYEAGIVNYGETFTLSFSVIVDSDAMVGNSIDNTAGLSRYLEDNTGGPIPIEESNTISINIGKASSTVPEPGTVVLVGLGLLGVLGFVRRSRQRRK